VTPLCTSCRILAGARAALLGRLRTVRDLESVGGWLHAVLRNACLMRIRCKQCEILSDSVGSRAAIQNLPRGDEQIPVEAEEVDVVQRREVVGPGLDVRISEALVAGHESDDEANQTGAVGVGIVARVQ
jgi:hypothetical protein